MTKVLVATEKPFAKVAVDGIREIVEAAGFELQLLEKYTEKQELLDAVKDVHAIIIRSDKVDAEVIDAAKELKIVVRAGAGYDNVDLAAATAKNVVVMNTPGQNSNAVAELVIGLLIFMSRNQFNGAAGTELMGKKIGIHAYGNVGSHVLRIAKGFGMEVFAFSRSLAKNPAKGQELGLTVCTSAEELYEKCDIISLHVPTNEHTKGSINYDLLSRMPKNGIVINTARKEVVNEADMKRIMEERPAFKYATDILPGNDAEMKEFGPRYFGAAKKMGAQTAEANINAGLAAARQIVGFIKDGDETFRVNK